MTPPFEPREAETVAVTLTRMEGTLNGVAEKVGELRVQVNQQGQQIIALEAKTQQLSSDARAAEATRVATQMAVKAANEARASAEKAQADRDAQRWTPVKRFYATLAALSALATVITAIYYLAHPS